MINFNDHNLVLTAIAWPMMDDVSLKSDTCSDCNLMMALPCESVDSNVKSPKCVDNLVVLTSAKAAGSPWG